MGSIVMHCYEFEHMIAFWQEALHYVPRAPASDGWIILCDPEGRGPNISIQARDRRAWRRSWLHLDLYTDCQQEEVRRLPIVGAKEYPWHYPQNADYVVLQDPDGNLFCAVQKRHPDAGAALPL
jgi:hypothetical protein